jgi:plastocyanin
MPKRLHRRRSVLLVLGALTWLLPGGDTTLAAEGGSCSPDGTALSITAFDSKFDKNCLAAPAGQAFTIDFSNLDRGIPHNLSIYEDKTVSKTLFKGELVNGPGKATYSVPGLAAGNFFFMCDPHPEMNGSFIAG